MDYHGTLAHTMQSELDEMPAFDAGLVSATSALDGASTQAPLSVQEKRDARGSLLGYTQATMPKYVVNWHHRVLAEHLEKVRTGEIKRLLVLTPPRHGKTQLVSRHFPAYCLAKNPNEKIIGCSYSAGLARSINRDVQRILGTPQSQYAFPNLKLATTGNHDNKVKNTYTFETVGADGHYIAAGIGGSITGKGFTIGIVDDPIKNRKEAESKIVREAIWEWWTSTFLTRGEGAFAETEEGDNEERIVVTLTPWNEDDLAGRILKNAKETGEEWTVLRFPAMSETVIDPGDERTEPGIPLWPLKYSIEKLEKIKRTVGSRDWNALYQCRPASEKGDIFERQWFKWYDREDMVRADGLTLSVDASFKETGKSYVVIGLWARLGVKHYLADVWRKRAGFIDTVAAIRSFKDKEPGIDTILIEDKANGSAILDTLDKEFNGLIPVDPEGSKVARAKAVAPVVEGGDVYLPRGKMFSDEFVDELATFPNGTHDDQVDMMTQYLRHYTEDPLSFLRDMTES